MKSASLILLIIILLFITPLTSQEFSITYEEAINKEIAHQYPEYYKELGRLLDDFQQELISKGVIKTGTYKQYVQVLSAISKDSTFEIFSDYAIGDTLRQLSKQVNYDHLNIMKAAPMIFFKKNVEIKSVVFNNKASQIYAEKKNLSRSDHAKLFLDVYNEADFQLPTIREQLYRFLDPNTDYILYTYIGKPTSQQ